MISTDLKNLSDWTLGYGARNEAMSAEACTHLSKVLMDLGNQVERLELPPVGAAVGRSPQERDPDGE